MTDRFYPMGQLAEDGVWKTTYEVMNEMRSFARSAYPPGTAVHQPGARASFGFSAPGPIASLLAKPSLQDGGEEVDVPNPREKYALTHVQIDDDRETFALHDCGEMLRSYTSPVASATLSPGGPRKSSMRGSRSLPMLSRAAPPRLSEPPEVVTRLEDDHFTYFVPRGMQRMGKDKMNTHLMSKLQKADLISFPHTGEGTGFRSQCGLTEVFPVGTYKDSTTSYRSAFHKKRRAPLPPMF